MVGGNAYEHGQDGNWWTYLKKKKTHEQSCDTTQLLHSCVHTHKDQKQYTVEVLHTLVYYGTASSCQAMRSV